MQKDKTVKLSDVARHAGVSPMTVSRVINGQSNVRDATKEKVLASIEALNYSPNLSARALAGNRAYKVALLYGNPSAFYLSQLLVGALEEISQHGHQFLVYKVPEEGSAERMQESLANLVGLYDGVIVPPPLSDYTNVRAFLAQNDLPAVYLSGLSGGGRNRKIFIDDRLAAHQITSFLIGLGHTRIGFITGNANQYATRERLSGYKDALKAGGIPFDEDLVAPGEFTYDSGLVAARQLLGDNPPTAVFASNDDMAAATLAVAAAKGLEVPKHLSVVGFDDSPLASAVFPRLTTVKQPLAEMAAVAVNSLINLIRSPNAASANESSEIKIEHDIIVGASTDRPAAR